MTLARDTEPKNLLVVFEGALSSSYLFEKARLLAGPATRVHVVQVIYEGVADIEISAIEDSARLKSFLLEAAETVLEEQLDGVRGQLPNLESATLWNQRHWEGILHAAAEVEADLILKAAEEQRTLGERVGSIVRTPGEWNLLRHAKVPVMIVKPQAWRKNPLTLCALDVFDEQHEALNLALLREAGALAKRLGGDLDLVCAYPLFEPWVGELGAVKSYAEIKAAVEEDIRARVRALTNGAGYRHLHLEEGHAPQVLARLAEEAEPALLVVGTHAREGVRGVLLGNTSERILHAVDTDILTVPLA